MLPRIKHGRLALHSSSLHLSDLCRSDRGKEDASEVLNLGIWRILMPGTEKQTTEEGRALV